MKKITKLFVALITMLCLVQTANAVVYRTGFQQFKYGCNGSAEADLTMTAAAITDTSMLDVTATTMMASISGTGNISNPVTGTTWKWADKTTFGYEAEIWLEPGTYTFWGRYDDGGAVVMEDEVVYTHGTQSGYGYTPPEGDFVVTTAGWYNFRGYVWDWGGGKNPCGDADSAIQMKKDGGDWVIDMEGVPARFATGEEYLSISQVYLTDVENVVGIVASVNVPAGTPANVYAMCSAGNIGYAPKANWAVVSDAQAITGTGSAQELEFTIDISQIENPHIVIYSESVCTDGLSEAYAADSDWNTRYGYSSVANIEEMNLDAPVFNEPTAVINDDGSATITIELVKNTGDVGVIYMSGETAVTNMIATAAEPGVYTATLTNLEQNKTYAFYAYGISTSETEIVKNGGAFYTGELSIEKLSDANEYKLVPGVFRISRADTAYDLSINLAISGTAVAGQTYEALSDTVTIPAGSTSVELSIVPILNETIDCDVSVIVALADGYYNLPAEGSVDITIINKGKLSSLNYSNKRVITPSESTLAIIGESTYNNFPALLRLPEDFSKQLISENGGDIFITDENGVELSFEIEAFDPEGETLVWVKVPSLSASTQLTVYYKGIENYENVSTDVWDDFVGVWHYSSDEAGGTTIKDSTINGLDGYPSTSGAAVSTYEEGPSGLPALLTSSTMYAPDYDSKLDNVAVFSASGWFKLPSQTSDHVTFVSKKTGLSWDHSTGWYLEMKQSKTKTNLILGGGVTTFYINDVTENWNYFNVVSDGTTVKVYINGSTAAAGTATYTITSSGKEVTIGSNNGCFKEYRLRNSVATAEEAALEYATVADAQFFTYSDEQSVDASAPKFGDIFVTQDSEGTCSISIELEKNSGDVGVIYESGDTFVTNMIATAAQPGTYTDTPSNLPVGKTYLCYAYGVATTGTTVIKPGEVFYNGDISIEKLSDANEYKLVPGVFRISRADTVHNLTVNLEISGAAIVGQTYEALPTTVTIPEGSTYVDIEVNPLIDMAVTSDASVVVSLAAGLYGIDASAASTEMTIINLVAPAGYNTWITSEAGLASDPNNWSMGRAPIVSDAILFDGDFSSASCTWDVGAGNTVASWTQTQSYSGTITFMTTYEDHGFEQFTITGDANINAGVWTHNENADTEIYRLAIAVGGDFTLGAAASIDVRLKGFAVNKQYPGASAGQHAGGMSSGSVYGDLYEPINLGSGNKTAGGGAVHLVVAGDAILEGLVTTQSVKGSSNGNGAPGSIYIKANTISGEGEILANSNSGRCSGGRIALVVTGDNTLAKSRDKLNAQGTFGGVRGGAGTILVKTIAETYGILYIDNPERTNYYVNHYPNLNEITAIPAGSNWIVDGIVFAHEGILGIHEGTTLTLPNGFASITGSSWRAGIVYNGGTIVASDADEETDTATIQGKWVFQADKQFIFPGNLIVKDEGAVGCVRLRQITNFVYSCDVKVAGDMTVEETGYLYADVTGHSHSGYDWSREYYGDAYAYGGQLAMSTNGVYGSILNPNMPGSYGGANDGNDQNLGGGLVKVTVAGTLTLDGKATAVGGSASNVRGTGGAFNITAGSLVGSGSIAIHGYNASSTPNGDDKRTLDGIRSQRNVKAATAGGRVAIRLTDSSATLPEHWLTSAAVKSYGGVYTNSSTKVQDDPFCASAGTVYIQTANEAEGAGTIYIRNNNMTTNPAYTPIPSMKYNNDEVLENVSLAISEAGRVRMFDNLKLDNVSVADEATLDLYGAEIKATNLKLAGANISSGTYTAEQLATLGYDEVIDSSEAGTGTIQVLGQCFMLIIR